MRIAGETIRRNYLSRYETNYTDKYNSEKKIYSGRNFDRASENPIDAARALRVRKSMSEIETYQDNLKTADSIYTNAESSLMSLSEILAMTYEKLVEGAHGTRNQDDLNIIALSVDNYAEEMVQSLNVDIADRKIFGGLNNETPAFKIEGSGDSKYVTYNGVAINSTNDFNAFPYSGTSYLDIGIGMVTNSNTDRIDDQSALPITFNGAECTGCGMTHKTASIELNSIQAGYPYAMNISMGGRQRTVAFQRAAGDDNQKLVETINDALKEAFQETAELVPGHTDTDPAKDEYGQFKYIDYNDIYTYKNAPIDPVTGAVDFTSMTSNEYYSLQINMNGRTKFVDFQGGDNVTDCVNNLTAAITDEFGGNSKFLVYANGLIMDESGKHAADVKNGYEFADVPITERDESDPFSKDRIDVDSLVNDPKAAETDASGAKTYTYAVNVNGKRVVLNVNPGDADATAAATNRGIAVSGTFGVPEVPYLTETGTIVSPNKDYMIVIDNADTKGAQFEFTEVDGYANNIMQLILDSAKLLRQGDQQMVARYADLLYAAQSNLSIAIADLGTNSKFIEFSQDRLEGIMINTKEKQNDIESTDLPSEITRWKVLESVYNASLQMGSSVLSQTIFDYIH
ncbi:MAG: hypothetical protein J6N15_01940 [Ruminiclostridium sp.]|nr:hypothetical protein [Ruminiclostridium sp.]